MSQITLNCQQFEMLPVAGPGFLVGGAILVGGHQLPRQQRYERVVCQNERIWTHGGGACARLAPLDPPMVTCHRLDYFVTMCNIEITKLQ